MRRFTVFLKTRFFQKWWSVIFVNYKNNEQFPWYSKTNARLPISYHKKNENINKLQGYVPDPYNLSKVPDKQLLLFLKKAIPTIAITQSMLALTNLGAFTEEKPMTAAENIFFNGLQSSINKLLQVARHFIHYLAGFSRGSKWIFDVWLLGFWY